MIYYLKHTFNFDLFLQLTFLNNVKSFNLLIRYKIIQSNQILSLFLFYPKRTYSIIYLSAIFLIWDIRGQEVLLSFLVIEIGNHKVK